MAFGFVVYTDDQTIQIDDTVACLSLATKLTVTLNNGEDSNVFMTGTFSYVGEFPVVAFSCPTENNARAAIFGATKVGNTWTFKIGMDNSRPSPAIRLYQCEIFIFDRPTASGTGSGIAIYDAAGKVTFSTERRPMKVESSPGTFNNLTGETTFGNSKKYALALTTGVGIREQEHEIDSNSDGVPEYFWTWEAQATMGYTFPGGYFVAYSSIDGGNGQAPANFTDVYDMGDTGGLFSGAGGLLVLDVTGF